MKRFAVALLAAACVASVLLILAVASPAQEAKPAAAQSTLVATIDLSPIQTELAALRAEMTALRQAVADPKGLREEVSQTTAATKALDARLAELGDLLKKQSEAIKPAIVALDPATVWEYGWLRTHSEQVMNRWGREGWQLVTAANDWLYWRRQVVAGRKSERPPEAGKEY